MNCGRRYIDPAGRLLQRAVWAVGRGPVERKRPAAPDEHRKLRRNADPDPGPAAAGVVFCNEKKQCFKKYSEYLGDKLTNNEAEYQAVIFALQKFKAVFGKKLAKNTEIEIKSDSELLVKQLNGEYKILEPKIQPLFLKIWNL